MGGDLLVTPPTLPHALAESEQSPAKRPKMMNTPPAEADETGQESSSLLERLTKIKADIVSDNEPGLTASWERLLCELREEVDAVTQAGSDIIPVIDFEDLSITCKSQPFLHKLQTRGAAIIRHVIPPADAAAWAHNLDAYLRDNSPPCVPPASPPELHDLFWSLAQLNARAHPHMLAAQQLVMSGCWLAPNTERLSTRLPVACADRVYITRKGSSGKCDGDVMLEPAVVREDFTMVDGADLNGFGDATSLGGGLRDRIEAGDWEAYDPWDSGARLETLSGLRGDKGASGVFKMFQGILPLSVSSADDDDLPMRLCPLPLKLTTAYRVLEPLFSPKRAETGSTEEFLHPSNWARKSHSRQTQETTATTLHPHLLLAKTLIALPPLNPGDYVIWHPDTIHEQPTSHPPPREPEPSSATPVSTHDDDDDGASDSPRRNHHPRPLPDSASSATLFLPCCPLTLGNAAYLAHQRRAFILGFSAPGFAPTGIGESGHIGRPGVREIHEAGGEDALRAMGLLTWDEKEAADEAERRLLKRANAVLFPDQR